MTDPTTAAPYDAGDAAPAVGYRLPTGDEREQLRAEVRRLTAENDRRRRELERVTAGRDHAVDLHDAASRELQELRRDLARIAGERNDARAERDRYRRTASHRAALLVRAADELHRISERLRRGAESEPPDAAVEPPSTPAATDGQGERQASAQEALQRADYTVDDHPTV